MNPFHARHAAAALLAITLASPAAAAADAKKLTPPAGAAVYGPNEQLGCKGAPFDALDYELKRGVKKLDRELQSDGRLCAVASSLLSWDPAAGESPPAHVVAFLSSHFGLVRPVRKAVVLDLDLGNLGSESRSAKMEEAKGIAEALRESLSKILGSYDQPRWGIASSRLDKTTTRVVIAMDDRVLELDDVPRKLEAGKQATLSGRVLPPYASPTVAISDVKGQVTKAEAVPGDAFKADLSCGTAPGDLWVEVQAERGGERTKVATFAVACGKDLPTSVALSAEAWPADARGQERRLADGVNAQRDTAGAPKLAWDEALAGVAREVAAQLRDQVARGEAVKIQVEPYLEKAGVASVLVLMNPAQAPTAAEVETQFAASPTTRQNVLHPEVNRVGVGVVPATAAGGKPAVFVVELFTKFLERIDPAQVQESLYGEVAKRRAAASASAMARDPRLEKVAQDYAAALAEAGGTLRPDDASEITHGIRIAYKSIDLVEGVKPNPLDFADAVTASTASALGIGVAQGDSKVLGKNAVFVTVIAATPRTADPAKPAQKKRK